MVYPDDIVAFQHTREPGTFLHCRNPVSSLDSAWSQSYLSLSGPEWGGWRDGALTSLPPGSRWVDGVICDIKITYVDSLHHATEFTDIGTTTSYIATPVPNLKPTFGLSIIHPEPVKNEIHVLINVPILVVVKMDFGNNAKSLWSGPVLQSEGIFLPFCPKEVAQTLPACVETKDAWFSSTTLQMLSVGEQTLSITVVHSKTWERLDLKVLGYEAVAGLSIEPHGCTRIIVGVAQTFAARVESGSSVNFTWMMDDQPIFTNQEPLYHVILMEVASRKLTVTANNPVSSQTASLLLTANEGFLLSQPGFLDFSGIIAVGSTQVFTLRIKADVSLPVTFRWNLGSGITHVHSAPCETEEGLLDSGVKHMYVQDSVNYTFTEPGDFTLTVQVFNQQSKLDVSKGISVRQRLRQILVSSFPVVPLVNQTFILKASTEPDSNNIIYTWDFGDSSISAQDSTISHNYGSSGVYNITVSANNSISTVTSWILVKVMEKITGLRISHNGPAEINSPMDFNAKVATGTDLNWKYNFGDGSHQENKTQGSTFHIYKSPGNYTVGVTVSNSVSELSLSIIVEVYKLEINGILPSACLPAGENVYLTALVNGNLSNLAFHWLFGDATPLKSVTGNSTTSHVFKTQGLYNVNLTVISSVSSLFYSSRFCVESLIDDVAIKLKKDAVAAGEEVCFESIVYPSFAAGLLFEWTISFVTTRTESNSKYVYASTESFTHSFHSEGTYSVALNVSNELSWKMVVKNVTVQDEIEGLVLNTSRSTHCEAEDITFTPTILQGTNVSYAITFRYNGIIQTYDFVEEFSISSLAVGLHSVTVKAWNMVSIAEISTTFSVIEQIQGLQLVNCCSSSLEALKELVFMANVENTYSVNYTWIFQMGGYEQTRLLGKKVVYKAPNAGVLRITVEASNGGCSATLTKNANVEFPVKRVELSCDFERVFLYYVTTFTAKANGSNLKYQWDFGDLSEPELNKIGKINHTYDQTGKYVVTVTVVNNVSQASKQLLVEVGKIECSSPQVSIIPSRSTIFKSRPTYFEATILNNCSAYKTGYTWDIFACPSLNSPGKRVNFQTKMEATSPSLQLPKNSLDVGQYCLVFTAFLKGTPVHVQVNNIIRVVHSTLVAAIKGGSNRLWPRNRDLVLDGVESKDPDVEPGAENDLEYDWTIHTENSTESHIKDVFGRNSSKMTVPSSQLHPGAVHVFTLTVYKIGRRPVSVNQTVLVSETAVPVTVECKSCPAQSSSHFSSTKPLMLYGQCEACTDQAQYKWNIEDQSGQNVELNEISSGMHSPKLVMRSGALDPGRTYTFSLTVMEPGRGQWGRSSLTLLPSRPPHGGLCELSPDQHILALDTVVTYNCSEWQPDDSEGEASQLIYSFQVATCESEKCPVLTLYRGIRSVFGSIVPIGSQSKDNGTSHITILVLIEDHLGATITALNRTVEVRNPIDNDGEWLRNKIHMELWPFVQHGNPQEIVPYSMVLLSHLNQVEPRDGKEVQERREMRQNVSQLLSSLPISSLNDAAQISSALTYSTAVPGELVSAQCQEIVLKAVGRLIHVMEASSEDFQAAVETGRNLLNVIGNTLAAVSQSVSKSVSSRPAPLASSLSLTALRHTGSVMRSLTMSHTPNHAPLSISTPHIRTLSFHGDPSNFLCTEQSNHPSYPCQFEIPNSLTRRLEVQNPQLVQVVLEIGDVLEDNLLLTSADPSISTDMVAMEISTSAGRPVSVQGLEPEDGIRVTLPWKYGTGDSENQTCIVTTLFEEERRRNFTVKDVESLDAHAGLYVSLHFSLDTGALVQSEGQVLIEVMSPAAGDNGPVTVLVTHGPISLTPSAPSTETTIFLSPLLNLSSSALLVSLSSPVLRGGPVHVSLCVFSSLCRFYDEILGMWSSEGLRPLEGTTLHQAHCLSQHLTMFGASLFLHPGAVVLLPPAGGPVRTVVPGLVVAVLALLHLLLGLISHRLDHWDRLRLSQVPLCGRPGLYHYRVALKTGRRLGAGTTAHVGISLYGVAHSGTRHLQREGAFQRGGLDLFHLETDQSLGEVWKVRLWHDNTGLEPSWFVQHLVVWDLQTDNMFFFLVDDWLSVENTKHGGVEREVLASCPDELCQFRRVLSSQLLFGLVDRHLWLSVWELPAHSHFTRGQRVSCCALSLHLYLALGALWYGAVGSLQHSVPVSALVLVNMETVAVGMTLALLVFPVQCLLCLLFGKTHSPVTVDLSVPPSPMCHSVEMDVCLDQSRLSGPSFMSLPGSSPPIRDSPSSLVLDSSILDLWAGSGLMPQSHSDKVLWPSCDSLLSDPPAPSEEEPPAALGRRLRRKKALSQRHVTTETSRSPHCPAINSTNKDGPTQEGYLTTRFTLSEENLMMSIVAAQDASTPQKNNSDSGRDSPATASPLSTFRDICGSGWSEDSDGRCFSEDDPSSLYRSLSEGSLSSLASTVLPSPSPDSTRCSSTTRIGVSRGPPGWLLPSCILRVVYPLVAVLVIACMVVVGLYGSFFSRTVLLMWLVSALSAALTSALLLEPLKVVLQAVLCSALWRPVDPEVEDVLAHETSVMRPFTEHSANIRPPCGYGLLQAKQEAHKVRALTSLMKHCVGQLLFLMLVLMVNYQAHVEQQNGRLLHSATKQHLHRAPMGVPNLTALTSWSDAEEWMRAVLVPHLHEHPSMRLVGLPWLQYTDDQGPEEGVVLGNTSETTLQLLSELSVDQWNHRHSLSVQWTHYHPESGLWLCGNVRLHLTHSRSVSGFLSLHPLLLPHSTSAPDLQLALPVLLVLCGLLMLGAELYSVQTERVQSAFEWSHCFHFLLASLSVATGVMHLRVLLLAHHCLSQLRHQPERYISFHSAALLSQRSSDCAAILLTLLVLRLLGTLRFVRRWVVMGRVLRRACRELWALALMLSLMLLLCAHLANAVFSYTVEGFVSMQKTFVTVLSTLRGHKTVNRLCRVHPYLGPLYSLLLIGGSLWLLARLCGAVLIRAYRSEKAQMFRPTIEPQDYEMVEFFIKRLKLWMGLTKAKEFRHRVKFEGMNVPPSRSSQNSRPSTVSSSLSPFRSPSPRPLSSSLSSRSEDSTLSASKSETAAPHLDRLLPSITALLAQFDRVNQLTDDVYQMETKLEDTQSKRQAARMQKHLDEVGDHQSKMPDVRQRRSGVLYPKAFQPSPLSFLNQSQVNSHQATPRTRNSLSESEFFPCKPHLRRNTFGSAKPSSSVGNSRSMSPASGFGPPLPRRRAWHSGSSHSADAAQRVLQNNVFDKDGWGFGRPKSEDGARRWAIDGIPIKRKAWISEGIESEEE